MKNSITAIVPAYNEENRIGNVLRLLTEHPHVDHIIVVDDCSTDGTLKVAQRFDKVEVISHSVNKGKTKAVHTALLATNTEFVIFVDADLIGLTHKNITDLIEPVKNGTHDVTISIRGNTPSPWKWIGIDYISGERVLRAEVLRPHFERLTKLPMFGLEVFMNSIIIKKKLRIKIVNWPNVTSPLKAEKYGFKDGVWRDIKMMSDIFRTVSVLTAINQIISMRANSIKYHEN